MGSGGKQPRVVLGSGSRWRREILEEAGFQVEVLRPELDESQIRHPDPRVLPLVLARAKAMVLLPRCPPHALLITGDQVVLWKDELREKPRDAEEARRFLRGYGDAPAETVSAVVVTNTGTGRQAEGVDCAQQWFRPLPANVIEDLVQSGEVLECAGGFRIEDPLMAPYLGERLGAPDSIRGLPLALTLRLMREVGA